MKHIPRMIVVPSGKCPFFLEGTDMKSVKEWVNKICTNAPDGTNYAPSALRYWIRHSYGVNSTEYQRAANTLDCLLDE